jgi:hypothetical protein
LKVSFFNCFIKQERSTNKVCKLVFTINCHDFWITRI